MHHTRVHTFAQSHSHEPPRAGTPTRAKDPTGIYDCTHKHAHAHMHVHVHVHVLCMCKCMCMCVHACMCTCSKHVCVLTACMCTHTARNDGCTERSCRTETLMYGAAADGSAGRSEAYCVLVTRSASAQIESIQLPGCPLLAVSYASDAASAMPTQVTPFDWSCEPSLILADAVCDPNLERPSPPSPPPPKPSPPPPSPSPPPPSPSPPPPPPKVNCSGLSDVKKCKMEIMMKKCEKKSSKFMKKCKKMKCKKDRKKERPLCQKACCELGFPV